MIGLRDKSWRRLGASLAGLALYLQLAFASWGMLSVAAPGEPGDALAGHALCLAASGGAATPAAPSDGAPVAPAHDHLASCCLFHSLPGITPQAALPPQPLVYAGVAHHARGGDAIVPGPRHGPANARAPPTLA
jgi:hypothetical protein